MPFNKSTFASAHTLFSSKITIQEINDWYKFYKIENASEMKF